MPGDNYTDDINFEPIKGYKKTKQKKTQYFEQFNNKIEFKYYLKAHLKRWLK